MKKGFTLVELLVVIAIIALLSTLSVVALNSARAKARDARRLSDIKQIRTALDMYYDSSSSYPTTCAGLGSSTGCLCLTSIGWVSSSVSDCTGTIFMQKVPKDPGSYSYNYAVGGNGATYTITYTLENGGAKTATPNSME